MTSDLAMIGFGEAAATFAQGSAWAARVAAYDVKADRVETRDAKIADYAAAGVSDGVTYADALKDRPFIFSLVTADEALAAARAAAEVIEPGTLYLDGNSVAPSTKQAASRLIAERGGQYVDMAIMAPVQPAARAVPILVSGPAAAAAASGLSALGFTSVGVVEGDVGRAAAVKMVRSILVKGLEALGAELALAAGRAGVLDAVLDSLDGSWREQRWRDRIDYGLDRMMAHGERRAAEMEEVARTLVDLGLDPAMTRGTIARQREFGRLRTDPPRGLAAKLAAIDPDAEEPKE